MTNCCHCGSAIIGKANSIRLKDFRIVNFHEDPTECYVKERIYNHRFPNVVSQELVMLGASDLW